MRPSILDLGSIAAEIYRRTCRSDFDAPGFCVVSLGDSMESVGFRQIMVDLKCEMAAIHESSTQKTLVYLSAARFDQQETTKLHRDGGPDECFLMLGYEPSEVDAEIEIADYSKCAFDLSLTPKEFLAKYNPMFQSGLNLLRPYSSRVPCFSPTDYQIICVNNSCAAYSPDEPAWQGTLHTAAIVTPDESKRRIVNSTMIAPAAVGTPDLVTESQQWEFIHTSVVRRRGYDKLHLDDDA